jgi:hypothetical protein
MPIAPRRVVALVSAVFLVGSAVAVLVVGGEGVEDQAGRSAQEPGGAGDVPRHPGVGSPDVPRHPRVGAPRPVYGGLKEYQKRCERLDEQGGLADVVYEAQKEMTRGDSATVKAAVTIDLAVPPRKILKSRGRLAEDRGIVVSCVVEARLDAAEDEFEIDWADWRAQSLLTKDTARWLWYVKPKTGGTHSLVLYVRPIMKIVEDSDTSVASVAQKSNVQQYETEVDVKVPLHEKYPETMTRLASALNAGETLVTSLTTFLLAIGALLAALGVRKRFRKKRATA